MVSLNGKIKDVYYVMEIYAQSYIDINSISLTPWFCLLRLE